MSKIGELLEKSSVASDPNIVTSIEIMDGQELYKGSNAACTFRYITPEDSNGYSRTVEGEVFPDALIIKEVGEMERLDSLAGQYVDDATSRRIVRIALFGYLADDPAGPRQLELPLL